MTEVILYAEDEGIALQSSAINRGVQIRVEDVTNDRVAFAINTEAFQPADISNINSLLENDTSKHFRSLLNKGDKISLSKNGNNLPDDELAHIYFNGHGVISIHGSKNVEIKKTKAESDNSLKLFLPSHITSSIDYIREAVANDLADVEHRLHLAINTNEKLHALLHDNVSSNLKETIKSEVTFLNGRIASLKTKKKTLSKQPNFEAARRKFLIEGLESFMKGKGYSNEFNKIKADALRKATESIGTAENDSHEQHKQQLNGHPLHNRFLRYFETTRPTPLPLFKCEQCGSRPNLINSKNPSTGKKRFTITCSRCDNKPKEHIHGHASHAIYHWAKDCTNTDASPSDVIPLQYDASEDGSFATYANLLAEYIETYKTYLKSYKDVHDYDSENFVSATMGKLRHLSDGLLIGKLLQKRINKEGQK